MAADEHVVVCEVVVEGRRVGERPPERFGVVGGEPAEAEGPQLGGDRVVADDDGPAVDGGFERWDAEALPRRGVEHGVGRGVRGRPLVVGERHPHDGDGRRRQDRVEGGAVALLGRPGQPVGPADRGREGQRREARPCARWRGPGGAASGRPGSTPRRSRSAAPSPFAGASSSSMAL